MKAKSSAHYQREYRKRLRDQGLVKKEVWILPEHSQRLAELEKGLRFPGSDPSVTQGYPPMSDLTPAWTTQTLYQSLLSQPLFTGASATLEIIEGVEPTLHIIMSEYGDLPLFLTVSGEQILVEALLWPKQDVHDLAGFNDAVLRTHKYFPLSTICLDYLPNQGDVYLMFGALSSRSIITNVVSEITVLASNVIQATEAYAEFLKTSTSE